MSILANYYWIKVEISLLSDPVFMGLLDATVGIYLKLYLLAGAADSGGLLCNGNKAYSLPDIAWLLRVDLNILEQAVEELRVAKLITTGEKYSIVRFDKEQGPGDDIKREQWRERQRKHREKHSENNDTELLRTNSGVTPPSLRSDPVDSESEKEKEIEKEVDVESDKIRIDIDKKSHSDSHACHGDNDVTSQSPLRGETTTTTSSLFSNEMLKTAFHILNNPINQHTEDAVLFSLRNKGIPANNKDEALEWGETNGYIVRGM